MKFPEKVKKDLQGHEKRDYKFSLYFTVSSFKFIFLHVCVYIHTYFHGGSVVKTPSANAGDVGSILESRRSLGEGNGSPLQCSSLEYHMDRGVWWDTVCRDTKALDMI